MKALEDGGKARGRSRVCSHIKGCFFGAILLFVVLVLVFALAWFIVHLRKEEKDTCSLICRKPKFLQPHPPLVVISLDGYAYKYLARKIQPTLQKMAECGVSAKVFPSFPTLTFPNHVTISNGLFPGHHGVVANTIYDTNLSQRTQYLGTASQDGHYVKEPIWSIYKRETNGKVGVISWIGTYHKSTYYRQPDYNIPFKEDMGADEKFDQIVEWLKLDDDKRPGLIMAYNLEPDHTGHRAVGREVDEAVWLVDKSLERFLRKLKKEGILGCVNIVIVSDHGMSEIKNRVVLSELVNIDGMVVITGANTLIFKNGSKLTDEEITGALTCKGGDNYRVFNRTTIPIRYHFSESKRVGDFIVVSQEHSSTYRHRTDIKPHHIGSHGYDYIDPNMNAIFFARGPSFKRGLELPPFMNVEYMNLWTKLLQLSAQENDGEPDFMNMALISSSGSPKRRRLTLRVCNATKNLLKDSIVHQCGECTEADKRAFKSRAKCRDGGMSKAMIVTSDERNFCYIEGCNELAIIDDSTEFGNLATLIEMYDGDNEQLISEGCTFELMERPGRCGVKTSDEIIGYQSLSAFPGRVLASNEHSLRIPWKTRFITEVFKELNDYTKKIVKKFGKVIAITGTAYNEDYSGKYSRSKLDSPIPTHLYRVLISCDGGWAPSGTYCQKAEQTRVLSFIFPHMDGDPNCLAKDQLLLQYSARVKDVEAISGLVFNFTNLVDRQQTLLKLHVNTKLW